MKYTVVINKTEYGFDGHIPLFDKPSAVCLNVHKNKEL